MYAAKPYEKQIKRDYNIELSRIDEQGEELGKVMGVRIATQCPNAFIALTTMLEEDKKAISVESSFVGEIVSVTDQQFVVFTLKDATGKTNNFFWLNFFLSDVNLADGYKKLLKKKVRLNYTEQEYFDPRIKEYKKYNVITSLNAAN
ncbi:hypothetical protein [Pontibacter harenae]|uniref:hypothetical protein n=1 Tax=Pontibacter harenae TaxID=2894083 RepID=UPI001E2F217A|nr:hypothetical protein [Pontibacter harenae]MCC9165436.1 hypothetical protein [Pontibacter harenae]